MHLNSLGVPYKLVILAALLQYKKQKVSVLFAHQSAEKNLNASFYTMHFQLSSCYA